MEDLIYFVYSLLRGKDAFSETGQGFFSELRIELAKNTAMIYTMAQNEKK